MTSSGFSKKALLIAAAFVAALMPVRAFSQDQEIEQPSILDKIAAEGASVVIVPPALGERLEYHEPKKPDMRPANARAGFRVQIFSDGNQATARTVARTRIRQFSARFPQMRTYLDYKSPYWRARVGDFKTREEANKAAAQIRRAFPAFSKEIRVVADRIRILEQ